MNLKLAKKLRKQARWMMLQLNTESEGKIPIRERSLQVFKPHEQRAREEGMAHVTAVNHPQTVRGIYRWLKRNHAKAIA